MKKRDLILLLVLLGCVGIWSGVGLLMQKSGAYVQVRIHGEVTASYPLNQDRKVTIEIPEGGSNVLVIQDGKAYMEEADCPDGVCLRHSTIQKSGESIICIPHALVVEISGSKESEEVDVIVQ